MTSDSSLGDIQVTALTMPQILMKGGLDGTIDLLKCDVEGAEVEIFADCQDWIRSVRYLVIELHGSYTAEHLFQDLRRGGVEPTLITNRKKRSFGHETTFLSLTNL